MCKWELFGDEQNSWFVSFLLPSPYYITPKRILVDTGAELSMRKEKNDGDLLYIIRTRQCSTMMRWSMRDEEAISKLPLVSSYLSYTTTKGSTTRLLPRK